MALAGSTIGCRKSETIARSSRRLERTDGDVGGPLPFCSAEALRVDVESGRHLLLTQAMITLMASPTATGFADSPAWSPPGCRRASVAAYRTRSTAAHDVGGVACRLPDHEGAKFARTRNGAVWSPAGETGMPPEPVGAGERWGEASAIGAGARQDE
jgi:hypothetical protein